VDLISLAILGFNFLVALIAAFFIRMPLARVIVPLFGPVVLSCTIIYLTTRESEWCGLGVMVFGVFGFLASLTGVVLASIARIFIPRRKKPV
jgi:hypothetical protein